MYYQRKITRGKWPSEESIPQATLENVDADTVVAEFRTEKNKLSVWKVENEEDLNDAFIALASNCESIGTIDAIKIEEDDLKQLMFDEELGDTPTRNINQKHCNIVGLNYVNLGNVIQGILNGLKKEQVVRKTKPKIKQLLADAYEADKLIEEEIAPGVMRDIRNTIEKRNNSERLHN